jgi:hypothetical protein
MSVPTTTQNAHNRMSSRNGNWTGSAYAAASVTMPRMPHQLTMTLPAKVGRYSPGQRPAPNKRCLSAAARL